MKTLDKLTLSVGIFLFSIALISLVIIQNFAVNFVSSDLFLGFGLIGGACICGALVHVFVELWCMY